MGRDGRRVLAACALAALTVLAGCAAPRAPSATASPSHAPAAPGAQGGAAAAIAAVREQRGLPPLRRSARLDRAARAHARDMARHGFFGHRGSDGSGVGERMRAAGAAPCGAAENIAMGPFGGAELVARWLGSPGHRRNLLNPGYTEYGLATEGPFRVMALAGRC